MDKNRERQKTILKAVFLLLIVVIIPLLIFLTHREFFSQFESISEAEEYIRSYGHFSGLIYLVLQVIQVVICFLPGEVFQVVAGYLFGPFWGIVYALAGCAIGEAVAFSLARVLGRGFVRLFMSEEQFEKYSSRLNSSKGYTLCFILYLIPGIPKDILCYVAGVSEIRFLPFLIISMVGRLPGLIGSIAMGSLVDSGQYVIAIVILVIACIICFLGFIFRDRLSNFIDKIKESKK